MPDESQHRTITVSYGHLHARILRSLHEVTAELEASFAAPPEATLNNETADGVCLLLDMAVNLCQRARFVMQPSTSPEARAKVMELIDPAWNGVYGIKLDSSWKRRLLMAVEYAARVVLIDERSGKRAPPRGDVAGRFALRVLFPTMWEVFTPHVSRIGGIIDAWRERKGRVGLRAGKFGQLAALWESATNERVTAASLEGMWRRIDRADVEHILGGWVQLERTPPGYRIELADPGT